MPIVSVSFPSPLGRDGRILRRLGCLPRVLGRGGLSGWRVDDPGERPARPRTHGIGPAHGPAGPFPLGIVSVGGAPFRARVPPAMPLAHVQWPGHDAPRPGGAGPAPWSL